MENGKRIEFKKAAKIVILAIVILMITGITAIEATTFSATDCPKCPESEIALTSGHDYTSYLQCFYYSSDIPSIEKAEGDIYVHEYSSAKRATNAFRDMCQYYRIDTQNAEKILSNGDTKFVYMVYSKEFPDIQIHGYFFHIERNVIIEVSMYIDTFTCIGDNDITKAKKRFDAFAKCAHSITGWKNAETKEEYTLTLKHYPPYYESKDGDPRRAGDLVATLTDKNDEGVSGKKVAFFVEGAELDKVLVYYMSDDYLLPNKIDFPNPFIYPETNSYYIGEGYTNEKGSVFLNYLVDFKPELLSDIVRETRRTVKGKIEVVVFDEKTYEVEKRASVNIELSSVAKITEISVYGELKNIEGEERKIRVMKGDSGTIPVYDKEYIPQGGLTKIAKCTPYHLLSGDAILLDKNDYVKLTWFTGEKMEIVSKQGFFKEGDTRFAKLTIGAFDFDGQTLNKIYEYTQDSGFSTITLGILGLKLASYSTPLSAISIVIAFAGKGFKEVPYVIMRPKSKILVDPTSSGINFYTVEGSNELITPKGFKCDVTTGHKISVLPDGTFSQISKFDRSELSDDLSYLLESIEKDESDKQSELKISKLYVGKSVYPRGTEVDVYYDVKNIGIVDVDEYHVECRINDLK